MECNYDDNTLLTKNYGPAPCSASYREGYMTTDDENDDCFFFDTAEPDDDSIRQVIDMF